MYPRIVIDLNKLSHNLDFLCKLCHDNQMSIAVVTKVFCADENIVGVINKSSADFPFVCVSRRNDSASL